MSEWPELMGKAAFARQVLKRAPSYVTALGKAGRLVLEGKGTHAKVRVAETLRLMANTKGARDDVAARHAENAGAAIPEPAGAGNAPEGLKDSVVGDLRERRAAAELRKSLAAAETAELEAAKLRGDLVRLEDTHTAMTRAGAAIRAEIELLADRIAPLVAPISDQSEVHGIIQEEAKNLLLRFGEKLMREKAELDKGAKA